MDPGAHTTAHRRAMAYARPIGHRRLHLAVVLLGSLLALELGAPQASAEPSEQRATAAGAFVDSVGVNTHLTHEDTAYGDFGRVRDALTELGVRHIRDGACAGCSSQHARLNALAALGIRSTLIAGNPWGGGGTLEANLDAVRDRLSGSVEALEGYNEPDISPLAAGDWVGETRAFQRRLWERAKADPGLRHLPVLGPSLVHRGSRAALGDVSGWLDFGNAHPYPGGRSPSANLDDELRLAAENSAGKPIQATETGYHTATGTDDGHAPASERAVAQYLPRVYLEYFRRGIARTFAYQLLDEWDEPERRCFQCHFGLLRSDFSRTPAFAAVRDLLRAVGDGAPADGPGSLRYEATGGGDGLRHLLLQDARGRFSLVLWREADVWERSRRHDLEVAPERVNLRFAEPIAGARVTEVGAGAWEAGGGKELGIDVAGRAVVVRLADQ